MKRDVRAIVMAEMGSRGYRQWPTQQVEAFEVDSAMDTDSDAFSISLGDPDNDFRPLLNRDTEVRAAIYTGPTDMQASTEVLQWGIADSVQADTDTAVVQVAGRDYTALAVDSMHPPGQWNNVLPHKFVTKDCAKLKLPRFQLAEVSRIPKFYTDGSETYWECWYRMYRKKKMWIWAEPDGRVIADGLNYDNEPRYYFGTAKNPSRQGGYLRVERATITSNKQRPGEVWVFGEKDMGKNAEPIGFIGKAIDPSISMWRRRPLKIMGASAKAKSNADARKEAWEELFEGKVGALEITLTIPDPGYIIRQNEMAVVRIPELLLYGRFFVVGTHISGGPDGYRQEIRLREKNFAISRRVPDDPELRKDPGEQKIPGEVGASVAQATGLAWADAFGSAAKEWHNGWDLTLFLGVLLAICAQETGFRNVRSYDDVEWYPKPGSPIDRSYDPRRKQNPPPGPYPGSTLAEWRKAFANQKENPLVNYTERAVGPMQLLTRSYKVWADEYGGKHDEYEGGRWNPRANVRAGARAFAGKLSGLDPKVDSNIWIGVERYYGSNSEADNRSYRNKVKSLWEKTYKAMAEEAIQSAQTLPPGEQTEIQIPGGPSIHIYDSAPSAVKKAINYALRQLGKYYLWGAAGPDKFDCSGLIAAAYYAAGLGSGTYPRWYRGTTYTYFADKQFDKVPKDYLLPGDMVFFRGNPPEHMGMYLSDGYFIQAPKTGDVVKVSSLTKGYYRDVYSGARRVVAWPVRPT